MTDLNLSNTQLILEQDNKNNTSDDDMKSVKSECLDNKNFSLLSNFKINYDQCTNRSRKRSEQMRKIKSHRESKDFKEDNQSTESYEFKSIDFRNYDLFNFNSNKEQNTESIIEPEQIIEPQEIELCELNNSLVEEHRSFVPITNNLTMKSNMKENNATPSYLLALNQCDDIVDEEEENDSITQLSMTKGKEPRHIRLPSGKNYLINSVIEEEYSELYTDSELSMRKKSYLMSYNKLSSSGKRNKSINDIEAKIEKNLNSEFMDTQNNNNKPKKSRREIAKSEVFNLQIDIKRTFDEISQKQNEKEEKVKKDIQIKKKTLMAKFMKKTDNSSTINQFEFNSNKDEYIDIGAKISEINKQNELEDKINNILISKNFTSLNISNNNISLVNPKKSPSSKDREIFYNNQDQDETNMSMKNPIIEENSKSIRERYKRERQKSSIFKSDDLRVSKMENINFLNQGERMSYININNNINICSPISINSINKTSEKKADMTIFNPIDLFRNNNLDFITPDKLSELKISPMIQKTTSYNLNLTINNDNNDPINNSSFIIKKKLFDNTDNLAISNAIHISIIQEKKEQQQPVLTLGKVESHRSEDTQSADVIFKTFMKKINTETLAKGRKASMEMKKDNNNKNTIINNRVISLNRKTNSTLHEPKINFPGDYVKRNVKSKESSVNSNKSRSESGKAKYNTLNTCGAQNKKDIATFLRPYTPGPVLLQQKNNSTTNIRKVEQKEPPKASLKLTKTNISTKSSIGSNNSKVPTIPKTTVSQSEIISNKTLVAEAMKSLNYQKSYYFDHHKVALEKLNKAKGGILLFISYSDIKKSYDFKSLYEISSNMLINIYPTNTYVANIININAISCLYTLDNKLGITRSKEKKITNETVAFSMKN